MPNEPRLVTIRPKISGPDNQNVTTRPKTSENSHTYPNVVVAGGHVVYPNVVFSQAGVVAAHQANKVLQANSVVYPKHVFQHSEILNRSLQANEQVYPKHLVQQSEISVAQQNQILLNEQLLAAQEKQIQEQNKILQANELIYPGHLVAGVNYLVQQNELVYPHHLVKNNLLQQQTQQTQIAAAQQSQLAAQQNAALQANSLVYPQHLVSMGQLVRMKTEHFIFIGLDEDDMVNHVRMIILLKCKVFESKRTSC